MPTGFSMPRRYSRCALSGIVGAQPHPREMREQIEVAGTSRHAAGLRRFVPQVQRLVGGKEVDLIGIARAHAEHVLHELQRVLDGLHHAMVLVRERRVLDPVEVEILGMVQVGEAALHQRADEVERHGSALVAAQQELRVGPAGFGGELGAVDVIAAIGGQADAVAGFQIGGAGLGVLAGEASDADHGPARADHQHQRHLQQDFERVGDADRRAIDEALGAIAGLQDELAPFGGFGKLVAQAQDFPTGDQRRKRTQIGQDPFHFGRVCVFGLL